MGFFPDGDISFGFGYRRPPPWLGILTRIININLILTLTTGLLIWCTVKSLFLETIDRCAGTCKRVPVREDPRNKRELDAGLVLDNGETSSSDIPSS